MSAGPACSDRRLDDPASPAERQIDLQNDFECPTFQTLRELNWDSRGTSWECLPSLLYSLGDPWTAASALFSQQKYLKSDDSAFPHKHCLPVSRFATGAPKNLDTISSPSERAPCT